MSGAYDQQLRKLIEHIQKLNQALQERDAHLVHWQQITRAVREERGRVADSLFDVVKQTLNRFAVKFQGLRAENEKLRAYIDHQKQLHQVLARDMQGQLQYALNRIDELASERLNWREELNGQRLLASKSQQQMQEQRAVIDSQQAALGELRKQLDGALVHAQREEQHQADLKHAQQEVAVLKTQLVSQDQLVAGKDRELQRAVSAYENLKQRATQEVQALQAELTVSRQAGAQVDERIDDLTAMLANSEREVARLFKDLSEERTLRKEAEIRLEATSKDLRKAKTAVTKLEKAERAAKGEQMTELQKRLDEMTRDYKELQEQLASAVRDKTAYMQALEGQKGKGRPRRPSSAEGS